MGITMGIIFFLNRLCKSMPSITLWCFFCWRIFLLTMLSFVFICLRLCHWYFFRLKRIVYKWNYSSLRNLTRNIILSIFSAFFILKVVVDGSTVFSKWSVRLSIQNCLDWWFWCWQILPSLKIHTKWIWCWIKVDNWCGVCNKKYKSSWEDH